MSIVLSCLLTVVLETAFLALIGFRSKDEIKIIICANVMTNLSMNFVLWFVPKTVITVIALELIVIAVECNIYTTLFYKSAKMYLLTVAANLISCGAGLLIFGF